jgi:hypothetical protein
MQIFTIIVAIILLITAVTDLSVGIAYYQILRWITTICAGLWAYQTYNKNQSLFILFCAIAILFNPIAPIYIGKELWKITDLVTSLILIYTFIKFKKQ